MTPLPIDIWRFAVDVGGTFTDIIAMSPEGDMITRKILSSGTTKGAVAEAETPSSFTDPARKGEAPDFWKRYTLRFLDQKGASLGSAQVTGSNGDRGSLQLDANIPGLEAGLTYELLSPEEAPLVAIRQILRLPLDADLPPLSLRLGTTRGTNALLERKGAPTALVTTRGFGDILDIGSQNRPELFDLHIKKPSALYREVVELEERIDAQGNILLPLNIRKSQAQLAALSEKGITALAVCLLHSYRNPRHEQQVRDIAMQLPFEQVSISSECAPSIKIVPRGDTTTVDAYLTPVIKAYVERIRQTLSPGSVMRVMTSAGGLVDARHFVGKDSILSGPAGGVVGYAQAAQEAGFSRAIGFDMGGTSTDVSRFDGHFHYSFETEKAGIRIAAPALAIETVAAGGGSICQFDGQKLVVGPESAGAHPGPACYGSGGPLTVTDCNLLLGRIPEKYFPFPLHPDQSLRRIAAVAQAIREGLGQEWKPRQLAEGFIKIANANMAKPIREVSIANGFDPRDHGLVSFGGAGAQHACAIADSLEIQHILIHPHAGVLSAFGIQHAQIRHFAQKQILAIYTPDTPEKLQPTIVELAEQARKRVIADGIPAEHIAPTTLYVEMRYAGQDAALTLRVAPDADWLAPFLSEHQTLYGHTYANRDTEVVTLRVEATGRIESPPQTTIAKRLSGKPDQRDAQALWHGGKMHEAPVFDIMTLQAGDRLQGPAIILDRTSTIIIDPGWEAVRTPRGDLTLKRTCTRQDVLEQSHQEADPVTLELFNNRFASIAEQMGAVLRNTALSTNIKERLDFSCALFTANGELVVNAPHIPVHLGAMGQTVRSIIATQSPMQRGDVFISNNPYQGGSHLPDITVVTPVYAASSKTPVFFTASRAHHAEMGGVTPGSLYTEATTLEQEGVLIEPMRLVDAGKPRWDHIEQVLTGARYPSRAPEENIADLSAQIAANHMGARLLLELMDQAGQCVVLAYMRHIREAAAAAMRAAIAKLPNGTTRFEDRLDNGAIIALNIKIEGEKARLDFAGTSPATQDNLNATPAIVNAVVLYCFRCLIDRDIPLNEGVLEPLEVILPKNSLLNPTPGKSPAECHAVAGGNVEISQRVADCIFGALGIVAASHGSMNNLVFGNDTFGYYETIGGGAGAGKGFDGASAVHTHMTNTRITDPEILELRYPVRLREFSIRAGSGGRGHHRGGDGIIREIEALQTLNLSVLALRRIGPPPYGLNKGEAASPGKTSLFRANGQQQDLGYKADLILQPGDRLRIETAGGGGFGSPEPMAP